MYGNLKDILDEYEECTLRIIKIIEDDKVDSLGELIKKRQQLVDEVLSIPCQKEENKKIYKEFQLDELQDKLNALISKKLEIIRNEIQKISKSKVANNVYNRGYKGAVIFSKKI